MNDQIKNDQLKNKKGALKPRSPSRLGLSVLITALISALVAGGGVYAWQNSKLQAVRKEGQQEIESLKQQITQLQNQISELQEEEEREEGLVSGVEEVQTCEWTGLGSCEDFGGGVGKCYQIKTDKGWEIVEYSQVGDLKPYVGLEVKWTGSRKEAGQVCTRTCPCNVVLYSVEAKIGEPQGQAVPKDWKTYRNEEYGFEVKYPSSLSLQEKKLTSGYGKSIGQKITIDSSPGVSPPTHWWITITKNQEGLTAKQLVEAIDDWGAPQVKNKEVSDIVVDNVEGKKVSMDWLATSVGSEGQNVTSIYLVPKGSRYRYRLNCVNEKGEQNYNSEAFNKLVSTFKFID